jgi:hypothetical protein
MRLKEQESLLMEMKNTKIWRLYQRYRDFIERKKK